MGRGYEKNEYLSEMTMGRLDEDDKTDVGKEVAIGDESTEGLVSVRE